MESYNFEVDEDTIIVLNIVSRFLKKYFNYSSDNDAIAAINNFYSKKYDGENIRDFVDLYFHHDHPFTVAGHIHFLNDPNLRQRYSDMVSYLRDINLWKIPEEAIEECQIWRREATGKL